MGYKHLIVHLDGGERTAERLEVAARLAGRMGARLTGLFAEGGEQGLGKGRARAPSDWGASLARARAAFEAKTREARLASGFWTVHDDELEIAGVAARYCRYGDLVVVGQHHPEALRVPHDFAEIVIVESGRPVLVVPWIGSYAELGRRVLVAWDGSRAAARALGDALPLLASAEHVYVAKLDGGRAEDGEGPGVRSHLAAHGIAAASEHVNVDVGRKNRIGKLDAILNTASDLGADLVVIGARGKSGVPFPRATGRTRASLASMTAPLLVSA